MTGGVATETTPGKGSIDINASGGNKSQHGNREVEIGWKPPATTESSDTLGGKLLVTTESSDALGGKLLVTTESSDALGGKLLVTTESSDALGGRLLATTESSDALGGKLLATTESRDALGSRLLATTESNDDALYANHSAESSHKTTATASDVSDVTETNDDDAALLAADASIESGQCAGVSATDAADAERWRVPYYLENFQCIVNAVINDDFYAYLFDDEDRRVVATFERCSGKKRSRSLVVSLVYSSRLMYVRISVSLRANLGQCACESLSMYVRISVMIAKCLC